MPKEIPAALGWLWARCRPAGGTLTLLHAQHVWNNCVSLMHARICVCVCVCVCVWVWERENHMKWRRVLERQRENIFKDSVSVCSLIQTLTVIFFGANRRGCRRDAWSKRQPCCAGGHWWKLTVGWNETYIYWKGCASFLGVEQWGPVVVTLRKSESSAQWLQTPHWQKMWNHQQGSFFNLYHQWLHRGSGIHNIQFLSISSLLCSALQYQSKHRFPMIDIICLLVPWSPPLKFSPRIKSPRQMASLIA